MNRTCVMPWGGVAASARGREGQRSRSSGWAEVWDPLHPSEDERKMDPRVVAATDNEAVVLWHRRGVNAWSERIDMETPGLYEVRDAKFARAHFDTAAVFA